MLHTQPRQLLTAGPTLTMGVAFSAPPAMTLHQAVLRAFFWKPFARCSSLCLVGAQTLQQRCVLAATRTQRRIQQLRGQRAQPHRLQTLAQADTRLRQQCMHCLMIAM
jgi:hypothetical protein